MHIHTCKHTHPLTHTHTPFLMRSIIRCVCVSQQEAAVTLADVFCRFFRQWGKKGVGKKEGVEPWEGGGAY